MKNKLAVLLLGAAVLAQTGLVAMADDTVTSTSAESEPATGGFLTRTSNTTWKVASFPLRFATGTAGMVGGAAWSGAKNVVKTEQTFIHNTFGQAGESPAMYPVGVLGTVLAVPIGLITGLPEGATKGGSAGYKVWDRF